MTITPCSSFDTFEVDYDFIIPVDISPVVHENPYFCYTHFRHGLPLYVGIAKDWRKRTRDHARQAPWFCAVDQLVVVSCVSERDARALEKRLIRSQEPLFNRDLFEGFLPTSIFRQRLARLYGGLDAPDTWYVDNPYRFSCDGYEGTYVE